MYKNFKLTDEERKQILEHHSQYGYRQPLNEEPAKNDKVAPCASLGVKTPGYCEVKSKKPVKPCAELGVKTPGYCYADTKQPINEDLNEQNPFMSFVKGFISPEIKVLRQGSSSIIKHVKNPAVRSLLSKYGTISMTDFVKGTLRPFEDNMTIFVNDFKKIEKLKVPGIPEYDYVSFLPSLKFEIEDVTRTMSVAKGKPLSLDLLYIKTATLNSHIDNILVSKQVKPQGIATLKGMKQTVNNALESIEDALGQIATRK
jgi:hypothetical protein